MKIGYVACYFHPNTGGTETYVLSLAHRMVRRGHEVIVHTSNVSRSGGYLPPFEVYDGIQVRRYRTYPGPQIFPVHSSEDVIHVSSFGLNPNVVEPLRKQSSRLVFTPVSMFRGDAYRFVPVLLLRALLGRYDAIVALTEGERTFLVDHIGVARDRVPLIPLGVDDAAFESPQFDRPSFLRALGIEGDQYMVSIGRVVSAKHFWLGAAVLPLLVDRIHYVIVGPVYDRYTKWEILKQARSLGVEERVHFLGHVSEELKRKLLHEALLCLVPGYEAFSIVALESMAQAIPIVAADKLGLSEVVRSGQNGLLFEYDNPRSAAASINSIIENPGVARRLGAQGRALALEQYRWDIIAEQTERVYKGQMVLK